jgi:alpha-glucosidase
MKVINNIIEINEHQKIAILKEDVIRVFEDNKLASNTVGYLNDNNVVFNVDGNTITTSRLKIEVKDDFNLKVSDNLGRIIFENSNLIRKPKLTANAKVNELLKLEGHEVESTASTDFEVQKAFSLDEDDKIYGLGDKTGFLNKRNYIFENWNTDDPSAHNESYKSLYKSIPFMIIKKKSFSYGLFFDNTFKSEFDLGVEQNDQFIYSAVKGNLDYYIFATGSIKNVITSYTDLNGHVNLVKMEILGHQQSRWSYETKEEVEEVIKKYEESDIPLEIIHLDIDYMKDYKDFSWDQNKFGDKEDFLTSMKKKGIKIVPIIDAGVKVEEGYSIYDEGVENNYFISNDDGSEYHGVVWPGPSVFPDFGSNKVASWWSLKVKEFSKGFGGIWLDMNEPASFNGPLPLDLKCTYQGKETTHERFHNLFGEEMAKATYNGLKQINNERPFVITRACYASGYKYSSVWTGDNQSIYSHLQMSIPQLLNLGMSGFGFSGCDIGGFGSNCTKELLIRWVQAAMFSPLFRNHSAKGCYYQEPYQFDAECKKIYGDVVRLRYSYLPYLYDLFKEMSENGLPIMRPLVMEYEFDSKTEEINDEFMVGTNLLIAPIVNQGQRVRSVYLPKGQWIYKDVFYDGEKHYLININLNEIAIFTKYNSIMVRYSGIEKIELDNINNLIIELNGDEGTYNHFIDDLKTNNYLKGEYNYYKIEYKKNILTISKDEKLDIYKTFTIIKGNKEIIIDNNKDFIEINI